MATMATCAIPVPPLARSHQRRFSQSVQTNQSQGHFLSNTGNLEVCNSEGLVETWRLGVSFSPFFLKKNGTSRQEVKYDLLMAIRPLDRGAEATSEDKKRIDQVIPFSEI
jgi:hypothetical protein